ncbi:hypothetical protein N1851_006736 [Merluccius polli]|uniref:DDE Tnp4 domain-containing protein n=1 Tax=Merluccius polli TaxID=89951 RepID=A0AA47N4V8_MERPO|nr:hypothetical protein N1851_006736 [Merluccius polli]
METSGSCVWPMRDNPLGSGCVRVPAGRTADARLWSPKLQEMRGGRPVVPLVQVVPALIWLLPGGVKASRSSPLVSRTAGLERVWSGSHSLIPPALLFRSSDTRPLYCRINLAVPVLDTFFNHGDTRQDFRLSRESLAVLLNLLHQDRRHGWGAIIETLVFLFWLASGASYRVVSRVFERSTAAMSGSSPQAALMAVCEHQGRFVDVYVGWPGSVHDSRVLRHSPLYRQAVYLLQGTSSSHGGYLCLQHPLPLITPYKRPMQGVGPQRFNGHHSHSIIARALE